MVFADTSDASWDINAGGGLPWRFNGHVRVRTCGNLRNPGDSSWAAPAGRRVCTDLRLSWRFMKRNTHKLSTWRSQACARARVRTSEGENEGTSRHFGVTSGCLEHDLMHDAHTEVRGGLGQVGARSKESFRSLALTPRWHLLSIIARYRHKAYKLVRAGTEISM